MFHIAVICLVITALMAYVNVRFIRLPTTIGVMAVAMLFSLGLIGLNALGVPGPHAFEESLLRQIDFSSVLVGGMLSMLLFAGALHVDLRQLRAAGWQVGLLAVVGTTVSTALVGLALWWALPWVGLKLPLIYCLLFGALISPTDPIAVLAILRSAGAPARLRMLISGESLFNDGVGVVYFALLLGMATSDHVPTSGEVLGLLAQEAGGGVLLGGALGWLAFVLLRSIDNYQTEVLLTLALVLGGYELAQALHISGPLAMVVAGLIVGNHGREMAMSQQTRQQLDGFWELLDEILNAVLFVLLGLEVVLVPFEGSLVGASLLVLALVLTARALAVGGPAALWPNWFGLPAQGWKVLTWGGLRGGISVALALALPAGPERDVILMLTYVVVVFSILVQGLSIKPLITRMAMAEAPSPSPKESSGH
ncbi:cation:proton antiporter [Ottowia sp.]|uniref:cation:proton antiporter n=1 Tax=Ottowia sp. TaxID=1898956 RepID=UPI003A847102